jgi:hypothetical protein
MFDDWFATVTSMENESPDLNLDEWKHMFGESTYQHLLDDDADDTEILGLKPLTSGHSSDSVPNSHSSHTKHSLLHHENVACAVDNAHPPVPLPVEISPAADSDTSLLETLHAVALICNDAPATVPAMPVVSMPVAPTVGPREKSPPQVKQLPPMREMSQPREQLNQQQSSPWRESEAELPTRANQQPLSSSSLFDM